MPQDQQNPKKRTAHIVSHTHWDREWRYPIWETRLMLVDFVDELIELLEKGAYPAFLMDGQCLPVLDYLEIRPENRQRVESLVSSGKLAIGPWYLLPDEYPIDGEALVRNLLWGNRLSKQLGEVMNIGYTPFGWGQTAQLAQIYSGFGMDVALIGKRVSYKRAPDSEFIWRSPDGSELLSTRFGVWGRQNFYFYIHLSALFNIEHLGPTGWFYDWANGGIAYHRADDEQMEHDHTRLDPPSQWYPEFLTPEVLDVAWETTDASVIENDRLMMNGCDYTAAQPMFSQILAKLNQIDANTDRDWIHANLPDFVELMKQKIDRSKLKVVEGELRDGPASSVTGNALTTRLYLKRKNKQAQNMLIRYAEPMTVAVSLAGAQYPKEFLRLAWQNLLDAHPHDSINGVTQDKTVADVSNRLDQVLDLSESLGDRAMQELVKRIDLSEFKEDDVIIVAFNPLPYPRREIIKAWVNMPEDATAARFWGTPDYEIIIHDADGNMIDTQWQGKTKETYSVCELHTRAFPFYCVRHLVYFDSGEIPAGGYKVFRAALREDTEKNPPRYAGKFDRTGTMLTNPNTMENEYLRVVMNPNGTFDLLDKVNNRTYAGLNYYEDRGENGDYWINLRPMFQQAHTSQGCQARIWSEENGPLQTTLVSEITMRLPARGIKEQQQRSHELEDLPIKTSVTLRAGCPYVEVTVDLENRHEDHYLRVMFPTGLKGSDQVDAGGHFIVDRRPIRPEGFSDTTAWMDMATLPQNNFVDFSDGKYGLALLNDSLTEYEVVDCEERVIALSLLRCLRNWVCTEHRCGSSWPSQKGGQALGHHQIRYAVMPHKGNWNDADIPLEAELFNIPPRLVQTRSKSGQMPPKQASLYQIDNKKLRFSAMKKTEDRDTIIFRIYNPTDTAQKGNLKFMASFSKAWYTNLNEERAAEIKLTEPNTVPITAAPYKIVTVEIQPQA
ncbi:MAG: alpha-mannosidase [Planctomycetota bacterium]